MKNYIQEAIKTEAPVTLDTARGLMDEARAVHALFGLSTEVGELTDNFKKVLFYGEPLDRTGVYEEVGDILWYLAVLMDHMGQDDFSFVMLQNIKKLKTRFPDAFTEHDAAEENRDREKEREMLEQLEEIKGHLETAPEDQIEAPPPEEQEQPPTKSANQEMLDKFAFFCPVCKNILTSQVIESVMVGKVEECHVCETRLIPEHVRETARKRVES